MNRGKRGSNVSNPGIPANVGFVEEQRGTHVWGMCIKIKPRFVETWRSECTTLGQMSEAFVFLIN